MIAGHTKFSLDRNFGTFENYINHNVDKILTI